MRAQKIYENIRFERGENPIKTLSIGKEEIKRKLIEETNWDRDFKPERRGVEAIRESVNFERGKDPLDAMDIGQKAILKERASQIEWDWYPDPTDIEKVLGLEKWEGINKYNIKIAKLTDRYGNTAYYSVSDTGKPYFGAPTFYETPGEALHFEKIFLKQFDEE